MNGGEPRESVAGCKEAAPQGASVLVACVCVCVCVCACVCVCVCGVFGSHLLVYSVNISLGERWYP